MTKEDLLARIQQAGAGKTHYVGCESEHLLCACHKLIAGLDDRDLLTLADIRAALGVNEKVMLSDLLETIREIRRDAERYKRLRLLKPSEIFDLWIRAADKKSFDEIIDEWV